MGVARAQKKGQRLKNRRSVYFKNREDTDDDNPV